MKKTMCNSSIEIRPVLISENILLTEIARETYFETFKNENEPEDMAAYLEKSFNVDQVKIEQENPLSKFYFALCEDQIIGYLKLNFAEAQTESLTTNSMEIERIYVLPTYHGKGIGARLLEKSFEEGSRTGVDTIWLGVWEKNKRAIQFYQRKGFVKFSEHDFWMGEDKQIDWMMKIEIN